MNEDILGRLMMDHALGTLEPDVEALLNDYLSKHADMQSQSSSMQEVVQLTKELLRTEEGAVGHVFREPHSRKVLPRRLILLPVIGAAAALMIIFTSMQDNSELPPTKKKQTVAAVVPRIETSAVGSGIWSTAQRWETPKPRRTSRLKWTSPVRQPEWIDLSDGVSRQNDFLTE
ncbi:MAG: hypothetical protein JXR23_00390 [Pontiellaceae bacterium]|nr:hypothetical protein [Pontiellaceae bacterium]